MKFQSTLILSLLTLFLLSNANLLAQCNEPLTLNWVQSYVQSSCTDKIYAFTYNNEDYIYATSTPSCIAADAANTLYNCGTNSLCYVFGFTMPSDQCEADLVENITPLLTDENVIYTPSTNTRNCANPLFMEWLSPLLDLNCTDGVYSFQHLGNDYLYRSTACEIVDDPNYLYNCATAEICYVQGRTFPELQCDLTEFPLDDYLIRDNLIWSTPLLDLVKNFPWLTTKLNIKSCSNDVVSRYNEPGITFVAITKTDDRVLYTADGKKYCKDRSNLNCLEAYNLTEPANEWTCNKREPAAVCEAIDADDLPSWLNEYISELSCECGGEILQYCYNDLTYISYEANAPFCADYAGFVFDENGTQICQNGGFTGGDCFTVLPNFFEEAELVNDLWSCEDCSNLAFEAAYTGCTSCCDDVIYYTIAGSSSYTVTSDLTGEEVANGDPLTGIVSPAGNIDLTVTTASGCSASTSFPFKPFCCEVPPLCGIDNVFYDCEEGLTIEGYGNCSDLGPFYDEDGNSFNGGDEITTNGTYQLTIESGGSSSPSCATYEVTVQCENADPCNLDAGKIITKTNLCNSGIGSVFDADYRNPSGPDDNEYVFVRVNSDDSFEVLTNSYDDAKEGCYYGIHYRSSCDVPNFGAATFSEILNANANYAITNCFEFTFIGSPEFSLTTAPYCSGEGLYTAGITVTGGSGVYNIGPDYTGATFKGEEGENFITFISGEENFISTSDALTNCSLDFSLLVTDPGCGTFGNICEFPADAGPCEAYIPRYYFNSEEGDCLEFIYGGCEGNANNFETYDVCIESCGIREMGDPFETEIVQSAISSPCTKNIYVFDQQNNEYIYITTLCQFADATNTLYNFTTGNTCNIGGLTFPDKYCDEMYNQVQPLINNENIIWSQPCNYEHRGMVKDDTKNGCGYFIELEDDTKIEAVSVAEGFKLAAGQRVELSYNIIQPAGYCEADFYVGITCIREIEEEVTECDSAVEPVEYHWVQNLINSRSLCNLFSIDQFDYNGNTYFRASPYNSPNTQTEGLNFNCPTDYLVYYYDCNGNEICAFGNLPLDDPQRCNIEIVDAANNNPTNIWTRSKPCPDPLCDSVGTPVCGVDGNTYSNSCEAECLGIEIAYYEACNTSNDEVFESFPWLLDLVDPVNCASGLKVDVYLKGVFNYIFVKYPAASGILYFQDGSYYCEDVRDFSCVAAYSLTDLVASWTCGIEPPTDNIEATFSKLVCNNNGTFSVNLTATGSFSGSYGIYGSKADGSAPEFFNFEEGEIYTFTGEISDNQNNIYTVFIYDQFLADAAATLFEIDIEACKDDEGGEEGSPIFEQYTWLNSIIAPGNCSNGNRVLEYDLGPYSFIFVETSAGSTLYFEDGTRYCGDRENFSCREVYNLTAATNSWVCGDVLPPANCVIENPLALSWVQEAIELWGADECGLKEIRAFNYEGDDYVYTLSYPIYPGCGTDTGASSIFDCEGNFVCVYNCFCEGPFCDADISAAAEAGDLIWEWTYVDNTLADKYEWLYDLVDPANCSGITINEYDNGAYAFITIADENSTRLYYEDGSLFCTDRENFSCVEAYSLAAITANWSCGFTNKLSKNELDRKLAIEDEIIKIYPNPNNGIFTVDVNNIKTKIQKIEIFDIAGKQHYVPINLNELTTTLKINASNLNSGSYIFTIQTANKLHTQTIIIH